MKKKPRIAPLMADIIKYVEDTFKYLQDSPPPEEKGQIPPGIAAVENEVNACFGALDHKTQAHILYFVTLLIMKLAGLSPGSGSSYSNAILMARTYLIALNKTSEPLGLDIVDIAFSVENEPTFHVKDGDIEKLRGIVNSIRLEDMEPKGNA